MGLFGNKKKETDVISKNGKYIINVYTQKEGGRVTGNWFDNPEDAALERKRYEKIPHVGYRFYVDYGLDKTLVDDTAKKHNMSVSEVLNCVKIPA
jgi:hypothetical protein